jgi:Ca2+/Na+ antiporter
MWWVEKKPTSSTQEELEEDRRRKENAIGWAVEIIRDTPALYILFLETSQMFIADHQTNAPKEKIGLLFYRLFVFFVFVFLTQKKKKKDTTNNWQYANARVST